MADMLKGGTKSWFDLTELYKKFLGRVPRPGELEGWGHNIDDKYFNLIANKLANTQEGKDYEQRNLNAQNNPQQSNATGNQGGGSDRERIDAMLQAVHSTDDPNYWYNLAAQRGGLDALGVEWTRDAINRGDGSELVRNGTLQKRGGGSEYGSLMGNYTPFSEEFKFDDFKAPEGVNEQNDPGFDSAMKNIKDTLEHSAAAKGSLLSGNTSKALINNSGQFALSEYQNLFGRELSKWNTNQQNQFNSYNQRRLNHDNQFGQTFALQNAQTGRDQFNASLASQNQNALNNLNFNYAGLGSGLIQNGANAANGYNVGGANAGAAGTVGSGNAYTSLFSNLSQVPWLAAYLKQNQGAGA